MGASKTESEAVIMFNSRQIPSYVFTAARDQRSARLALVQGSVGDIKLYLNNISCINSVIDFNDKSHET